MQDTELTLWILHASNGKYSQITYVYARDEQHARERARSWIEAHPDLTEHTFKAHPWGFVIHRGRLPGKISVQMGDVQGEETGV